MLRVSTTKPFEPGAKGMAIVNNEATRAKAKYLSYDSQGILRLSSSGKGAESRIENHNHLANAT